MRVQCAFTLSAGGARSRCVLFGAGTRLPAEPQEPVQAVVRLDNGQEVLVREQRSGVGSKVERLAAGERVLGAIPVVSLDHISMKRKQPDQAVGGVAVLNEIVEGSLQPTAARAVLNRRLGWGSSCSRRSWLCCAGQLSCGGGLYRADGREEYGAGQRCAGEALG